MSDTQEKDRLKRIKREISRLNQLFKDIAPKKKKAVESLVKNAAFMAVTLEDLQEEINLNGVTEKYQNGANQSGIKKSSAVEVYNTMIKNHVQVMKSLTDLIPKEAPKTVDDGFEDFVINR
jgi:malonyl CoA-acyl carrier protein transacylase